MANIKKSALKDALIEAKEIENAAKQSATKILEETFNKKINSIVEETMKSLEEDVDINVTNDDVKININKEEISAPINAPIGETSDEEIPSDEDEEFDVTPGEEEETTRTIQESIEDDLLAIKADLASIKTSLGVEGQEGQETEGEVEVVDDETQQPAETQPTPEQTPAAPAPGQTPAPEEEKVVTEDNLFEVDFDITGEDDEDNLEEIEIIQENEEMEDEDGEEEIELGDEEGTEEEIELSDEDGEEEIEFEPEISDEELENMSHEELVQKIKELISGGTEEECPCKDNLNLDDENNDEELELGDEDEIDLEDLEGEEESEEHEELETPEEEELEHEEGEEEELEETGGIGGRGMSMALQHGDKANDRNGAHTGDINQKFNKSLNENKNTKVQNESKLDELKKENEGLKKALKEYKESFVVLRKQINEVQTFNAKLAYANKLFSKGGLSTKEKIQIAEQFDKAETIEDAKKIYNQILKEGKLNENATSEKIEKQILSSKTTAKNEAKTGKLYESKELSRMKQLAGIK